MCCKSALVCCVRQSESLLWQMSVQSPLTPLLEATVNALSWRAGGRLLNDRLCFAFESVDMFQLRCRRCHSFVFAYLATEFNIVHLSQTVKMCEVSVCVYVHLCK